MIMNPEQFPTYKSLFPVQTTQTSSQCYLFVILHQLSVRLSEVSDYVSTIDNRTVSLEKRQTEFHGQLTQLDGKFTSFSNSPVMKEVETLAPRVNLLEKQLSSIQVRQKVTPVRSNPAQAAKKQYTRLKRGTPSFRFLESMDCQLMIWPE